MLGDDRGLDPLDQPLELAQMNRVERHRRTKPESNAMKADRQTASHDVEHMQVIAAIAEIVLAVHLDPVDRGRRCEKVMVMRMTQPNTDAGWRAGNRTDGSHVSSGLLQQSSPNTQDIRCRPCHPFARRCPLARS
jgi:hypothetical protein